MSKHHKLRHLGQPTSLIALAIEHDIPYSTLNRKWADAGKPEDIPPEMIEQVRKVRRGRRAPGKRPGMSAIKARQSGLSLQQLYSDPNYLPHIPHGDLAHLSDKGNTGAARTS